MAQVITKEVRILLFKVVQDILDGARETCPRQGKAPHMVTDPRGQFFQGAVLLPARPQRNHVLLRQYPGNVSVNQTPLLDLVLGEVEEGGHDLQHAHNLHATLLLVLVHIEYHKSAVDLDMLHCSTNVAFILRMV